MLSEVLGGIGLFLIGMILATDGLRAAAGDAMRRVLLRFTGGPIQALVSGAAVTALVQSSSATTVATIGFVTAGLLTFSQALGLIIGANIGTTATGWLVALVGLKFSVSTIALPAVGIGAMIRLFGRGRWKDIGLAIAGFGTLFVGLDVLQGGMSGLTEYVTPESLPDDTFGGRISLIGIGFAMTAVMQSSSAGVATALAALHAGTISLAQAAAMVIGINVGTTATAGIAAIGGSTAAKRTAFAHLLFNAATGLLAFASLPIFVRVAAAIGDSVDPTDATITIAAFHTAFNLLGVLLILPFMTPFAAFVERVIVSDEPELTARLDKSLTDQGGLAIEAVRATALDIARVVVETLHEIVLRGELTAKHAALLDVAAGAIDETHEFIGSIRNLDNVAEHAQARYVGAVHALDRLEHLIKIGRESLDSVPIDDPRIESVVERALPAIEHVARWLADPDEASPVDFLAEESPKIAEERRELRALLLGSISRGEATPDHALSVIDGVRRIDQTVFYMWRLASNLEGERKQTH